MLGGCDGGCVREDVVVVCVVGFCFWSVCGLVGELVVEVLFGLEEVEIVG